MLSLKDQKGQMNMMVLGGAMMAALMLAILAMVYGIILPLLNASAIGTGYNLLVQLPTVVIALGFASIVMVCVGGMFLRA